MRDVEEVGGRGRHLGDDRGGVIELPLLLRVLHPAPPWPQDCPTYGASIGRARPGSNGKITRYGSFRKTRWCKKSSLKIKCIKMTRKCTFSRTKELRNVCPLVSSWTNFEIKEIQQYSCKVVQQYICPTVQQYSSTAVWRPGDQSTGHTRPPAHLTAAPLRPSSCVSASCSQQIPQQGSHFSLVFGSSSLSDSNTHFTDLAGTQVLRVSPPAPCPPSLPCPSPSSAPTASHPATSRLSESPPTGPSIPVLVPPWRNTKAAQRRGNYTIHRSQTAASLAANSVLFISIFKYLLLEIPEKNIFFITP